MAKEAAHHTRAFGARQQEESEMQHNPEEEEAARGEACRARETEVSLGRTERGRAGSQIRAGSPGPSLPN